MNKNIQKKIKQDFINKYKETVWVYLKQTNVKGANYDPYLNVGQQILTQSPEPVKAVVRAITADSLIARELGLIYLGAIEIIVDNNDVNLFKICQKVKYNDTDYTPYIKAVGNKCQIYKNYLGYSKIVLTLKGN